MAGSENVQGEEGRVGIFVSHKATDRSAALAIKRILESESSRLDVHVFESTPAGAEWEKWIFDKLHHSQVLILLYTDPSREWDWCLYEAGLFTPLRGDAEQSRQVVCLYDERKPEPLRALQAVQANSTALKEQFLVPLFLDTEGYLGIAPSLNPRKSDEDLASIADRITEALQFNTLEADYVVTALRIDLPDDLDDALPESTQVHSMSGPLRLFGQLGETLAWGRLVELAQADQMKGTAWHVELERGILAVARGDVPDTITATFRGKDSGCIYSSLIYRVDRRNDRPARVYVAFLPVIVPELVRGPGAIGDVYMLVRLANRFRYEVVEPYLKRLRSGGPLDLATERRKISESIGAILDEAERHDMMDMATVALLFPDARDQEALYGINVEWEDQFKQLAELPETPEKVELVNLLDRMQFINTEFLKMASRRYARLTESLSSGASSPGGSLAAA